MPSFDVVSEVDLQEVHNAVDQTNREIRTRFDLRGVEARVEREEDQVRLTAEADFQLGQIMDILRDKLVRRGVDVRSLEENDPEASGKLVYQICVVRQGIDRDLARRIVKMIKEQKIKVQAAIQGDQVRVTSKKRDELQKTITMLKEQEKYEGGINLPLQYQNFRD
ncbi:MAG: YajQ family cyclic di-GMP-binding protein [Pseudomonadota bacterium]|nr:YajQ family cyclic di-GMP-binding protein [Pseudomonadota bacterium]